MLADEKQLELLIAGRSFAKANAFCEALQAQAKTTPLVFDRDADVEDQLKTIQPDVVVDATGPFQDYGDDPYRIIKACIANSIDYMDLADGSDFVKGVAQFDSLAKTKNIYVLSGVSSFPVLTAAVVRNLSKDFSKVRKIFGGIAPSPYAGVGLNVIRAIASYAGKPLPLVHRGKKSMGYAFTETLRYTIAPPGYLPLDNIRFSLVDVPDLQVLPELWPGLDSIWMGAGPVPEILHRMLNGLAWLVRKKILSSLSPFASLFYFVTNFARWGEHRGGMFVSVKGLDQRGNKIERSWHLLAEGDDGPYIPSMAVEAVIRRILAGNQPQAGARTATRDLELEDYEALFKTKTIYTGIRESDTQGCLYKRMLNSAWDPLPAQIKEMHESKVYVKGLANIERGEGWLASLIARAFRFPEAGEQIPVKVVFTKTDDGEIWKRTFGEKSFTSYQYQGSGKNKRLVSEKFGPLTFGLALVVKEEKLFLVVRRWSLLGIPLPRVLAPNGASYEYVEDGKFNFDVEIKLPLIGLIVRYQGWLK